MAAVIRTLYYFQVDALILPAADTCSLDSVTKIRKDFKDEVESVELKLFQDKRTKSIQRMSAGAYDLYAKRIFLTKGATRFVRSTKDSNNEKIKDSSNKLGNTTRGLPWKIVVCSPPPSGRADAQAAANYLSIYDQEEIKELKKNPLVVIFGHESSGIRKPILDLADVHLVIPRFDSCHILGERGLPAVDSLNLSVSVGIIMSYLISFK